MPGLRLLDPQMDLELFRQSYAWRPRPKKHVQPDRMSFDDFLNASVVVGLFEPELVAVFVFCEFKPQQFECHFAAVKGVPRGTLLIAAGQITTLILNNGAECLVAWTIERNRPTRSFVEQLGFVHTDTQTFVTCQKDTHSDTLIIQTRNFVKYELSRSIPSD